MELNVPQVHFTGMFKHSIAGLASLYVGNGLILGVVENFKIRAQIDRNNTFAVENANIGTAAQGSFTSTVRALGIMLSKIESRIIEQQILHNRIPTMLTGVSGVLLGTLLVHPLDTQRVRQAQAIFSPPMRVIDRNPSLKSIITSYGWNDLYLGLLPAVLHATLRQIIAKSIESLVDNSGVFSSFEHTLNSRLNWFVAFSVATIILNPIEVVKRRLQSKECRNQGAVKTFKQIYSEEGISGLMSGWAWAVPEAFATVLVTHFAFKGVVRVMGGE